MVFRNPLLLVFSSTGSDCDRTARRAGVGANALRFLGLRSGKVGEVNEIGRPTEECSDNQVR